jgi:hypothetical protein
MKAMIAILLLGWCQSATDSARDGLARLEEAGRGLERAQESLKVAIANNNKAIAQAKERLKNLEANPQGDFGVTLAPNTAELRFVFTAPDGFRQEGMNWGGTTTDGLIVHAHVPGAVFQTIADEFIRAKSTISLRTMSQNVGNTGVRPTLLVHWDLGQIPNQAKPQTSRGCTVVYGTSTGCAQITAVYPTDATEEMKRQIQTSMLNSWYTIPD